MPNGNNEHFCRNEARIVALEVAKQAQDERDERIFGDIADLLSNQKESRIAIGSVMTEVQSLRLELGFTNERLGLLQGTNLSTWKKVEDMSEVSRVQELEKLRVAYEAAEQAKREVEAKAEQTKKEAEAKAERERETVRKEMFEARTRLIRWIGVVLVIIGLVSGFIAWSVSHIRLVHGQLPEKAQTA